MATQAEIRQERKRREAEAIRLLRDGASDEVAAAALELPLISVQLLRRWLGLKPANFATPEMAAGTVRGAQDPGDPDPPSMTRDYRRMRAELVAHLGDGFVFRTTGDDPVEIMRAHVALRAVFCDVGPDLIESVRGALRESDRARIAEYATGLGRGHTR